MRCGVRCAMCNVCIHVLCMPPFGIPQPPCIGDLLGVVALPVVALHTATGSGVSPVWSDGSGPPRLGLPQMQSGGRFDGCPPQPSSLLWTVIRSFSSPTGSPVVGFSFDAIF